MRRATVDVLYKGVSITDDISNDVLSFSYTDNADGVADDISLTIANASKKWLNEWMPSITDTVCAKIQTADMGGELDCGLFIVDGVSFTGRPLTVSIKGLSTPVDTNFSEVDKNKTWQKATLKDIASTMAGNAGIPLDYEADYNPTFDFLSQVEQTDKAFLYEQCQKFGLSMKMHSDRLIIYDPVTYEHDGAVASFAENDMLSWNCEARLTEAGYSGCRVQYTNPTTVQKLEYIHQIDGASAKVFEITTPADSLAHAQQICKAKLRSLNMTETTISFSIIGNALITACMTIDIVGMGVFSGKYFIDKVTHKVGGGYTTAIEAHLVT